jgi:hypothetical protein
MHAARKKAQHASRIVIVDGLAKDGCIHYDDRVRPQHHIPRPRLPDCESLLARQTLGAVSFTSAGCTTNDMPALRRSS